HLGIQVGGKTPGGCARIVSNSAVTVAGGDLKLTVDGSPKFAAGDLLFLIVNNGQRPVSACASS
ncbi:MAG: hypothetical protein ACKOEZ_11305, partial [Spartobacteria bacterium]